MYNKNLLRVNKVALESEAFQYWWQLRRAHSKSRTESGGQELAFLRVSTVSCDEARHTLRWPREYPHE